MDGNPRTGSVPRAPAILGNVLGYFESAGLTLGLVALGAYLSLRKRSPLLDDTKWIQHHDRGNFLNRSEACLMADCDTFAQEVSRNPRDAEAWFGWGAALSQIAKTRSGTEADQLLAQAAEKCSAALALVPDDMVVTGRLVAVLARRGELNPGEAGRPFLTRACELCDRMVAYSGSAFCTPSIRRKAACLWTQLHLFLAQRLSDLEADSLYARTQMETESALRSFPADGELTSLLASVLAHRAELSQSPAGTDYLMRATALLEPIWLASSPSPSAISILTNVLLLRAERLPGDQTTRYIEEAAGRFKEEPRTGSDAGLLGNSGLLLLAQALALRGARFVPLLEAAKARLAAVEARQPGICAYSLARISARLGQDDECRDWLRRSREPGVQISRDRLLGDPSFAGVRDSDWFREMVRS